MKGAIILTLLFALIGCTILEPDDNIRPMPKKVQESDNAEYFNYLNELNSHLLYLYTYTKIANDKAVEMGWVKPKIPILCLKMDDIDMATFQPIKVEEMSEEDYIHFLTSTIRDLKIKHRKDRERFERSLARHYKTCVF